MTAKLSQSVRIESLVYNGDFSITISSETFETQATGIRVHWPMIWFLFLKKYILRIGYCYLLATREHLWIWIGIVVVMAFCLLSLDLYSAETPTMVKTSNMCEKLMKIFIVVAILQSIILCLNFLRDPFKSQNFASLLPPKIRKEYWYILLFPFLLSLLLDLVLYWNVILLDLYVILMHGAGTVSCLKEIM